MALAPDPDGFDLAALRRAVLALDLPEGDWALFGSAPMLAHGLLARIGDVDVVARGPAWARALELGPVGRGREDRIVRAAPGVDVFDGWLGMDLDGIIDGAERRHGLPFAGLEHVLAYKRRLGRPRDREHIARLERALGRSSRTGRA